MNYKNVKKTLIMISLCILLIGVFFINGNIGVFEKNLESDIRKSQRINDEWIVEGSVGEEIATFISYPEDKSSYTLSVYLNHKGASIGYFFRYGGASPNDLNSNTEELVVEGRNERAFISMNHQKINKIETDNGVNVDIIDVDSDKPFAVVIPKDAGIVTLYNVEGNVVEYIKGYV